MVGGLVGAAIVLIVIASMEVGLERRIRVTSADE